MVLGRCYGFLDDDGLGVLLAMMLCFIDWAWQNVNEYLGCDIGTKSHTTMFYFFCGGTMTTELLVWCFDDDD